MPGETHHSRYLHDIPLELALERFGHAIQAAGISDPLPAEIVPLNHALGERQLHTVHPTVIR